MTLDCLVSNPLRKQMFHQDCIDLHSLNILTYIIAFMVKYETYIGLNGDIQWKKKDLDFMVFMRNRL